MTQSLDVMGGEAPLHPGSIHAGPRRAIAVALALTGFSAIALQVVWQRVISIHSGVDLSASTTVVAGFLAGLGLGSLIGGRVADRIGRRGCVGLLAAANFAIGVFAWFSTTLFYDGYRAVAVDLRSPFATVAFNVALLLIPTTLQGLSMPLVARVVTYRSGEAGPLLGRLSGINTMSAAFGSIVAGWYLIGNFGFVATARFAGMLNVLAALLLVLLLAGRKGPSGSEHVEPVIGTFDIDEAVDGEVDVESDASPEGKRWPWPVLYAVTGGIALSYQVLFFRFIDMIMRSNSYSFSLVLALYLGFWALGAWLGARWVARVDSPKRVFFGLQLFVAVSAALGVAIFVRVVPVLGGRASLTSWFSSNGFAGGFDPSNPTRLVLFALVIPAALMAAPITATGASFPFIQAIVVEKMSTLAWRTGLVGFANVVGNVGGVLLTGYVLMDRLGTIGTLRLLTLVLGMVGAAGLVVQSSFRRSRWPVTVAAPAFVGLFALPDSASMWRLFHGDHQNVLVAEDHSCVSVAKRFPGDRSELFINGAAQNGFPFDDFHVLIGLLPSLIASPGSDALAVGFGAGSTSHSVLLDPTIRALTTVELCGGNYVIADRFAEEGITEFERLAADRRHERITGDGRKHMLVNERRFDVIVVDTLVPSSANSGSHYSKEFYELISESLNDGGVVAQWVPTGRVLNSVSQVFPYVQTVSVPSYNNGVIFLASRSPIAIDRAELIARFDQIDPLGLSETQRAQLRDWMAELDPVCVTNGVTTTGIDDDAYNQDLRPRDEYGLNNDGVPILAASANC